MMIYCVKREDGRYRLTVIRKNLKSVFSVNSQR